jgi:hypothetical protein
LGQDSASQAVSRVALGLTLVVALYIGYKAFRDRSPESFERASFKTLAFYLLVTCLWFFQWYTLWLLCLIPLLPAGSAFRKLAVVFGFTAISKQFFIGPILFWGSTNFVQPKLEIIFTLGTLGPTWLYALFLLGRDSRLLQALWAKIRRQKLELAYVPVTNEDPLDHYHGNGMD